MAHQIGSAALFAMVRSAFVHGMDIMLAVCGGIAVAGIVLTLVFLPRRSEPVEIAEEARDVTDAAAPGLSGAVAASRGQGAESSTTVARWAVS